MLALAYSPGGRQFKISWSCTTCETLGTYEPKRDRSAAETRGRRRGGLSSGGWRGGGGVWSVHGDSVDGGELSALTFFFFFGSLAVSAQRQVSVVTSGWP